MSAAQRAMAVAMIYPEAEKGGRGKKNSLGAKGFSGASPFSSPRRRHVAPPMRYFRSGLPTYQPPRKTNPEGWQAAGIPHGRLSLPYPRHEGLLF
jgi:hypothetical protein